jgi:hypothetical protein
MRCRSGHVRWKTKKKKVAPGEAATKELKMFANAWVIRWTGLRRGPGGPPGRAGAARTAILTHINRGGDKSVQALFNCIEDGLVKLEKLERKRTN